VGSIPTIPICAKVDQWQSQLTQNQYSVGSSPTFGIMKNNEPIDYRLRAASKRTDLPDDVIRLLADAYYEVWLGKERVQVLQDKHDSLLATNEELEARIKNLKEGFEGGCHLCEVIGERNQLLRESNKAAWAANEELEKKNAELEQERDELRREICGYSYDDPRGVARDRGWDCFKEEQ
jgi:cell division protein FtsB